VAKIEVVVAIASDGSAAGTEEVDGDTWRVEDNGVLHVTAGGMEGGLNRVATFAAGSWFRVLHNRG